MCSPGIPLRGTGADLMVASYLAKYSTKGGRDAGRTRHLAITR